MGKILFPSRPKPNKQQNNDIHKKGKFDKQKQKQKTMFINTIKDMRKIVQNHYGSYIRDTLGMNKKNQKVPYNHLIGRRNKIAERYSHQKARARQQNIQYDSSLQLLNSNIIEDSKRKKDEFDKNKYKFQGINEGKLGRQSDGMLKLSKKDVRRINGKQPQNNQKRSFNNNSKHKKIRKGNNKKGGKKHFKK